MGDELPIYVHVRTGSREWQYRFTQGVGIERRYYRQATLKWSKWEPEPNSSVSDAVLTLMVEMR